MQHLVLFDIDGTLLRGGPAKDAFHLALLEAFGTAGDIDGHDFSGKTDPQIARELLAGAGLGHDEIDRGLPILFSAYLRELEARLPDVPVEVLPGIPRLIEALMASGDVALGLVTGNIARGADLKLDSARLRGPFHVGGFGSDSEVRDDLPPVALERARSRWAVEFSAERVWIVGDTPRDVGCARAHGLRSLAVATGHFTSGALREAGAERVMETLDDTDAVVEVLRSS
jgi:phosphoglycolate phosphatase-like HAD superfamily hydrolase